MLLRARSKSPASKRKSRRGFTLIELLVIIAIFGLTVGATVPFVGQFQQTKSLQSLAEDVTHTLVRAQSRSMTGDRSVRWGVRFLSGSYVLYGGTSYGTRQTSYDESHSVHSMFGFSGRREFTFEATVGRPVLSGSLVISNNASSTARIVVNTQGGIFLNP